MTVPGACLAQGDQSGDARPRFAGWDRRPRAPIESAFVTLNPIPGGKLDDGDTPGSSPARSVPCRSLPAARAASSRSRSTASRCRCPPGGRSWRLAGRWGSIRRRFATWRTSPRKRLPRLRGGACGCGTLVPACSRQVETDGIRPIRRASVSRARWYQEFLGSSVDLPRAQAAYCDRYDASPEALMGSGSSRPCKAAILARAGHHHQPEGNAAETVAQPVKVDNDLYIATFEVHPLLQMRRGLRDGRPEHVRDRRRRAWIRRRISTGPRFPTPRASCGNCVCPTVDVQSGIRPAKAATGTNRQTETDTICPTAALAALSLPFRTTGSSR